MSKQTNSISQPHIVAIYMRNSQKKARTVKVPRTTTGSVLTQIASQKMRVPKNHIKLFLRGHQVQPSQQVVLKEKYILHVVNMLNVLNQQTISISVKRLKGHSINKFTVKSNENIGQFVANHLEPIFEKPSDDLFLVYTGKQLDPTRTFEEENVQNLSQLLCISLDDDYFAQQDGNTAVQARVVKSKSDENNKNRPSNAQIQEQHAKYDLKGGQKQSEVVVANRNIKMNNNTQNVQVILASGRENTKNQEQTQGKTNLQHIANIQPHNNQNALDARVQEQVQQHTQSLPQLKIVKQQNDLQMNMAQIDKMINAQAANLHLSNDLIEQLNNKDSQNHPQPIPSSNQKIVFRAGDLIYSGQIHELESQNMLTRILSDFQPLLASNSVEFKEEFRQFLPKQKHQER